MHSVRLLSVGAAHGFMDLIGPRLAQTQAIRVEGEYDTAGATVAKLRAGVPADVVVVSEAALGEFVQAKVLIADGAAPLGAVVACLANRSADPVIDIGDVERLRRCLVAAPAIFVPDIATSTAGRHFAGVLRALDLAYLLDDAERLRVCRNGAAAMGALASTTIDGAIGCTQSTEILATPGLKIIGSLPDDLALTTVYWAAKSSQSTSPAAETLLRFITGADCAQERSAAGFMPADQI